MLIEILRRTPVWVWALLAALLALGVSQLRARRVSPAQLFVLPVVLLALGLLATATSFVPPAPALASWASAFAAASAFGRRLPRPAGAAWDADGRRLWLPGSALRLVLIIAVFMLRYTGSVALALHPAWRAAPAVMLPMAATYGAISGLLLGRALALLPRPKATMACDADACHA